MTNTDTGEPWNHEDYGERLPGTDHRYQLKYLPDDGEGTMRHYRIKSMCSCGWESRVYRDWSQARNAALKHGEQVRGTTPTKEHR